MNLSVNENASVNEQNRGESCFEVQVEDTQVKAQNIKVG